MENNRDLLKRSEFKEFNFNYDLEFWTLIKISLNKDDIEKYANQYGCENRIPDFLKRSLRSENMIWKVGDDYWSGYKAWDKKIMLTAKLSSNACFWNHHSIYEDRCIARSYEFDVSMIKWCSIHEQEIDGEEKMLTNLFSQINPETFKKFTWLLTDIVERSGKWLFDWEWDRDIEREFMETTGLSRMWDFWDMIFIRTVTFKRAMDAIFLFQRIKYNNKALKILSEDECRFEVEKTKRSQIPWDHDEEVSIYCKWEDLWSYDGLAQHRSMSRIEDNNKDSFASFELSHIVTIEEIASKLCALLPEQTRELYYTLGKQYFNHRQY